MLHRVAKAVTASEKYKSAMVRDYALLWNGREYSPSQLETLPGPLRPSTLATRKSDQAMVFFSRHAALSNHHPSIFKVQGTTYHNMEQFLAHKRATLSGQEDKIQKALNARNPGEAKFILNSLKDDHVKDWEEKAEVWATEGIRAKFQQNENLAKALCNTGNRQLGEASRNLRWGVGMDLNNQDVLDCTKWPAASNLLGRILMKIREEIQEAKRQSQE